MVPGQNPALATFEAHSSLNTLSPLLGTVSSAMTHPKTAAQVKITCREKDRIPQFCHFSSGHTHCTTRKEVEAWPYSRRLPVGSCSQQPRCNEYWKTPSSQEGVKLYWKFTTVGSRVIKPPNAQAGYFYTLAHMTGQSRSLHTMRVVSLPENVLMLP